MLCKVSYRHGPKTAVVAENLESLIDKGIGTFLMILYALDSLLSNENIERILPGCLRLSLMFANED